MTCLAATMRSIVPWKRFLPAIGAALIASTVAIPAHADPGVHRAQAHRPIIDSPALFGTLNQASLDVQRRTREQDTARGDAKSKRPAQPASVTSCDDDGESGTLRAVIAAATDGDTIDLSDLDCGSIVLVGGEINVPMNDLTINGPGRDLLSLDGSDTSRIFSHAGQGTLEIRDITLTRGRVIDGRGGCVSSESGSVALVDAAVAGCSARAQTKMPDVTGGGGVFAVGGISLIRSKVVNNTASTDAAVAIAGGGLLTRTTQRGVAGNIDVTDSLIAGNQVLSTSTETVNTSGGGLDSSGTATIVRSTVSENLVSSAAEDAEEESITRGGGLRTFGLNVSESIFRDNQVLNTGGAQDVAGGAIAVSGTALISGSTIEGNHSGMLAGGVLQMGGIPDVSRIELVNSTISENTAGFGGGGLAILNTFIMRNTTVAFNSVDVSSPFGIGGVLLGSDDTIGAFRIESSIISNNSAADQAMFAADLAIPLSGWVARVVGANNLVGEISGVEMPDDTLTDDPLLAPLADNGGRTRTCALSKDSPALDAGNNSADLDADQRGLFYVRAYGMDVDIGAFELQPEPDVIFASTFDP